MTLNTIANIFVYGARGHGKVVADILQVGGQRVCGFIDDCAESVEPQVLALPVCGGFEWLKHRSQQTPVVVVLGIGKNEARQEVAERCRSAGIKLLTAIHPDAVVSTSARIGDGTVIMARAVVNPDAIIGECAVVNTGAVVEHDCVIGDYAHLSPNSSMGGAARLGALSWLGMSAAIIHGVSVGVGTVVGAGAVVIRDLPDSVVAVGVPARICSEARENASG
jgi:sugar O-acyltransferase (sialic acid O-acetyltransferase NeuD family)